jgi:hypothetical protein
MTDQNHAIIIRYSGKALEKFNIFLNKNAQKTRDKVKVSLMINVLFWFCCTEAWTQGLKLYHLSYTPVPFCFQCFFLFFKGKV